MLVGIDAVAGAERRANCNLQLVNDREGYRALGGGDCCRDRKAKRSCLKTFTKNSKRTGAPPSWRPVTPASCRRELETRATGRLKAGAPVRRNRIDRGGR